MARLRKRVTTRLGQVAGPLLSRLVAILMRVLGATWRIEFEGSNPLGSGRPAVAALWHRDILITAYVFRDQGYSVPVSRSRDGDYITSLLLALGYTSPPRGSSSRGGAAALRGLVRLVSSGTTVSLPVDGPKGPPRRAKLGVVSLARLTGVAITPLAFSARPCMRFGSWDGTLLPSPFARVTCHLGAPIAVQRDASPEDEERIARELDAALDGLTDDRSGSRRLGASAEA
jgi:hypothetical protein